MGLLYLVNIHTINISDIFAYANNRYYFNVLKLKDIDMYIDGHITSLDILNDIELRFTKGIVLFNIHTNSDDIKYPIYDNVENAFI